MYSVGNLYKRFGLARFTIDGLLISHRNEVSNYKVYGAEQVE